MNYDPMIISTFGSIPKTTEQLAGRHPTEPAEFPIWPPEQHPLKSAEPLPLQSVEPQPPVPNPAPAPTWPTAPQKDAWLATEGQPETASHLNALAANLKFGDGFPEPIRFDPVRQALVYRGIMLSSSYTYLRRRSDDPDYLAALDELYIRSSMAGQPTHGWRRLATLAIVGISLVGAAVLGYFWLFR